MMPWLMLAGAAAGLTLWPVAGLEASRAALADGELWRLWTGPLRHADPAHLVRDLMGMLGLAALMRGRLASPKTALLIGLGLPLPVIGALLGDGTLAGYFGLSGLIHAFAVVALFDLAEARPRWSLALGLVLLAKVLFEMSTGALAVALPGVRAAVWGHATGFALGGVLGLLGRRPTASHRASPRVAEAR